MFESAVSFDQPLSNWSMATVQSLDGMFENAASFQQKICWPTLKHVNTSVTNLFCGAHAMAHLDPCCVPAQLIAQACCGTTDYCDFYCGATAAPSQPEIISNDPPAMDDEEETQANDTASQMDDDDETIGTSLTMSPSRPTTSTASPTTTATTDPNAQGLESSPQQPYQGTTADDESSLWQDHLWLRIAVALVLVTVVGLILFTLLKRFLDRRLIRQNQLAHAQQQQQGKVVALHDEEIATEINNTSTMGIKGTLIKNTSSEEDIYSLGVVTKTTAEEDSSPGAHASGDDDEQDRHDSVVASMSSNTPTVSQEEP
jgi:Mycoplasma protein of unknown function, DUF285